MTRRKTITTSCTRDLTIGGRGSIADRISIYVLWQRIRSFYAWSCRALPCCSKDVKSCIRWACAVWSGSPVGCSVGAPEPRKTVSGDRSLLCFPEVNKRYRKKDNRSFLSQSHIFSHLELYFRRKLEICAATIPKYIK